MITSSSPCRPHCYCCRLWLWSSPLPPKPKAKLTASNVRRISTAKMEKFAENGRWLLLLLVVLLLWRWIVECCSQDFPLPYPSSTQKLRRRSWFWLFHVNWRHHRWSAQVSSTYFEICTWGRLRTGGTLRNIITYIKAWETQPPLGISVYIWEFSFVLSFTMSFQDEFDAFGGLFPGFSRFPAPTVWWQG